MYPSTISNEEVNALELYRYEGRIKIITKPEQIPGILKKIAGEKAVGFDTETKPAFKKGQVNEVSLVQIATEKEVYLIRINFTGLTKELIRFLEDEKHLKIGVALRDDLIDLKKLTHFHPQGFIELNKLVKGIGIESNGLRKLTAIILGFRISKSAQISNWESEMLTEKQVNYAATDAWVCLKMYNELVKKGYLDHA
ncbi:3'- 5' exonuclease domain protein [Fulvivirga imtechensis AK7]|uniref:3'-5' exonuclease domain protein n=1 Tax=Fulvivirga imtechensis AK7 TaxID=1237149 RepID=L8JJX3_9BACT|nr:3'-5' exonuclease [Fulvivirga imtechensis]ELR69110.1 3'- 5' exonuclease domain protein [Fulvivirga imtechensis AK7]